MSNQPTLQDLRKAKFATIKAFAKAYGCSASKASMILQGRYQGVLSRDDVQNLADVFGVALEVCIAACNRTFTEWCGHVWDQQSSNFNYLEERWEREEAWREQGRRWRAGGDVIDRLFAPLLAGEALAAFGLSVGATEADVMRAYRSMLREAHKNGHFQGDMDDLKQKKDKALAYVKGAKS